MNTFPLTGALDVDLTVLGEVDSTNRYAADHPGDPARFRVVVSDNQTAGRGRQARQWQTPPGAGIAFTVALPEAVIPRSLDALWLQLLSLMTGAIVAEAVSRETPDEVSVKWPNDVLIGEKKVAGILGEIVPGGVIIGIGINVEIPLDALPTPQSTSLHLHGAATRGLADRLVSAVVSGIMTRLPSPGGVVNDETWGWLTGWMSTVGRDVRVEFPDGHTVVGRAIGLERDGSLRVQPAGGGDSLAVTAGEVWHLRHASASETETAHGSR